MPRKYNIRWTEADNKELARVVKNYNAKVKRLETKYKNDKNVVLPKKVSVAKLKDLIGTRQDLKRELNSLRRFSERGAETLVETPTTVYNIQITKWQRTEMNRRAGIINRTRAKRLAQIKEIPMSSGGKELGYSVGEFGMGRAEELSLSPTNAFTPKMDKYDLVVKFRSLVKHSQSDYFTKSDERLLSNYTNALRETYGEEAVKDIVDKIENMDFNQFYKTFKAEPGAFEFASDIPNDADIKAYLTKIRSTWLPEGEG